VTAENESNGRIERPAEGTSVLANLPRTRPQRATARRAAARRGGEAEVARKTSIKSASAAKPTPAAKPVSARPKAATGAKRTAAPTRLKRTARTAEPVPRQGFESEGDRASGPVSPPGGIELLASAAELLGELTKAGVSTGERLLRDVLSHLPGT
jgi:hypothetical protein